MTEENPFDKNLTSERKVTMEDDSAFGDVIRPAVFKMGRKAMRQAMEELEVHPTTISNWQTGVALPDVEKLPSIARLFDIDLVTLQEAYRLAHQARELKKKAKSSLTRTIRSRNK